MYVHAKQNSEDAFYPIIYMVSLITSDYKKHIL